MAFIGTHRDTIYTNRFVSKSEIIRVAVNLYRELERIAEHPLMYLRIVDAVDRSAKPAIFVSPGFVAHAAISVTVFIVRIVFMAA